MSLGFFNHLSPMLLPPLLNSLGCFAHRDNTWLGFGLSGSTFRTQMFGADATIVWVDDEDGPQAEDYFLSTYSQVSQPTASTH